MSAPILSIIVLGVLWFIWEYRVLILVVLLAVGLAFILGCSTAQRTGLVAGQHRDVLVQGMQDAERMLGYSNTARVVKMQLVAGTHHKAGGRWGVEMYGKQYGGWIEMRARGVYRIYIVCDPATMVPAANRVAHECGRVLLYERGMLTEAEQDKQLKEAGL